MPEEKTKTCFSCKKTKSISDFNGRPGVTNNTCKECAAIYQIQWREKNKDCVRRYAIRQSYGNILHRCYNPSDKRYKDYGGSGVTVCDEWREDPQSFFRWATGNGLKRGMQIHRINNVKLYSPETCEVLSRKEHEAKTREHKFILKCRRCGKEWAPKKENRSIMERPRASVTYCSACRKHAKEWERVEMLKKMIFALEGLAKDNGTSFNDEVRKAVEEKLNRMGILWMN